MIVIFLGVELWPHSCAGTKCKQHKSRCIRNDACIMRCVHVGREMKKLACGTTCAKLHIYKVKIHIDMYIYKQLFINSVPQLFKVREGSWVPNWISQHFCPIILLHSLDSQEQAFRVHLYVCCANATNTQIFMRVVHVLRCFSQMPVKQPLQFSISI